MNLRNLQRETWRWARQCFGVEISTDKIERNHRFFEEATELVQALNMSKEDAYMLVDYVYNRPIGEPKQELGGVLITLSALSNANALDMGYCAETELERIWDKMPQIREKQKNKPRNSPLPESNDL